MNASNTAQPTLVPPLDLFGKHGLSPSSIFSYTSATEIMCENSHFIYVRLPDEKKSGIFIAPPAAAEGGSEATSWALSQNFGSETFQAVTRHCHPEGVDQDNWTNFHKMQRMSRGGRWRSWHRVSSTRRAKRALCAPPGWVDFSRYARHLSCLLITIVLSCIASRRTI